MPWLRYNLVLIALWSAPLVFAQNKDEKKVDAPPKKKPKFTVGKETTYVDGPIDKDGYIDYVAALNDKLREGVTPDNNANVLLWKAFGPNPGGAKVLPGFFEAMKMPAPPQQEDYFIDLDSFMRKRLKLNPRDYAEKLHDEFQAATEKPWTAKNFPHLEKWLAANEKPLAIAREATKRTHFYQPLLPPKVNGKSTTLIAALLTGIQECRSLASALTARAMLRLGEGKTDDAWQDLQACHRLGRLIARGGTLIELLVGIAIDQIASKADLDFLDSAKLDAKKVKNCLRDLQTLPPMPVTADKVDLAERFMFLDTVMQIDYHGVAHFEILSGGGAPPDLTNLTNLAARLLFADVHWDSALRNGNIIFTRMATAMRLKDRTLREKQLEVIERDIKTLKANLLTPAEFGKTLLGSKSLADAKGKYLGDVMITLLVPAVRKVQGANDRSEQVQRNLHLAFALAAYQRDEGRYPLKLEALAPKYLPAIPGDLFSGKTLVYRPADNGYLLYSVGVNGKDDGGRSSYADDLPGDDLVVRMPIQKMREK